MYIFLKMRWFDQIPQIDYACMGEGEYVMLELAEQPIIG